MGMLYLSLDLTSQEMAAWVQAIGSSLAIVAAAGIAIWQGKKQLKNALDLLATERKHERMELAKTLSVLANVTLTTMCFLTTQINSKQAVHDIVAGKIDFDLDQLRRLDAAIEGIKLHELPATLVAPTMSISASVRQCIKKIDMMFHIHPNINSDYCEVFFTTLGSMKVSVENSCNDITEVISKYEAS